jgi:DNA repair protein RadC
MNGSWSSFAIKQVRCCTAGGAAFAVAHNHPSGDPSPSASDRRVTTRLREAADTVGVRFLDHVVVTDGAWMRVTET